MIVIRRETSKLSAPSENPMVESWQVAADALSALHGSIIITIVQALKVIKAASDEHGWNTSLSDCLTIWKGGSLGSSVLTPLIAAVNRTPDIDAILEDPPLASELTRRQLGWRRIVTLSIASGKISTILSSSLMYHDSHRIISTYRNGDLFQYNN